MTTEPKREHELYICLGTSLVTAGTELIEMAGAITERREASDFNLNRAETAVRRAAEALAEYRRIDDADPVITWERPASHGRGASRLPEAPGMRASHMLPLATLDALNGAGSDRTGWADAFNTHEADGDDTPDEAA